MFTKTDIRKIRIAIKRADYEEVIYELGKLGLIHLEVVHMDALSGSTGDDEVMNERRIDKVLSLLESYIFEFNIEHSTKDIDETSTQVLLERNARDDEQFLLNMREQQEQYKNEHAEIIRMISEDSRNLSELEKIKSFGINIDELKAMKLCRVMFGPIAEDIDEESLLNSNDFYIKQYDNYVLAVSLSGRADRMLQFLNGFGFNDRSDIILSEIKIEDMIASIEDRIDGMKDRKIKMEKDIHNLQVEWKKKIEELYNIYTLLKSLIEARKMFLITDEIVFIDGWIVYKNSKKLISILKKFYGDGFFLTISSRAEMRSLYSDVPVILKNNRLFKPFELITRNFGLPGNRELDPTPIATIVYILMFGVMFGDVGQGLVLVLTGIILRYIASKRNIKESFISYGGGILIVCGISAAIFGLFWGSIFSHEHLIPALWFHPMEDIMKLFFATIMMGASFITIGLSLNILNGLRIGHYEESLLGTKGMVGLIVYIGAVFILVRNIQFGIPPQFYEVILFIVVPIFLFSFRTVLAVLFLKKETLFPHGILEYFVESIVEIIEMFSSFLGNTISFVRAGAFALSHAGLSIAFYTLAEIISPDLSHIGAISVIVIGNIFIILLEGLVCSIQSLRLEYYEFFGKFFQGAGTEFKPFLLRK